MTVLISPIIERKDKDYFFTTADRFFNLFTPIQATGDKESEFSSYLATPLIDIFILEPAFAIDSSIHFLNAVASFAKACHTWTMNQKESRKLIDNETSKELAEAE